VAYMSKGLKLQLTCRPFAEKIKSGSTRKDISGKYEGWNFNSGNYLFTTDTK